MLNSFSFHEYSPFNVTSDRSHAERIVCNCAIKPLL